MTDRLRSEPPYPPRGNLLVAQNPGETYRGRSLRSGLSLSDAVLPLPDTYPLVVQATTGGGNSYAPVRV
jgi:hypothetical protein